VAEASEFERELRALEVALRQLETEYNMYFSGQLPRPPLATRTRVERLFRAFDRAYIQSYADRFRLASLQNRFTTFVELWDRGLRAREEGRPGPFARPPEKEAPPPAPAAEEPPPRPAGADGVLRVETLSDPAQEREKLIALYDSLIEARRATGNDEPFPFHRFAQMVKTQVTKLHEAGSEDVSFRVAVKDGKVAFSARGLKGAKKA